MEDDNIYYIINNQKKVFINFANIKSKCKEYELIFASKILLNKHNKNNWVKIVWLISNPSSKVLLHIIKSFAITATVKSGYIFRK